MNNPVGAVRLQRPSRARRHDPRRRRASSSAAARCVDVDAARVRRLAIEARDDIIDRAGGQRRRTDRRRLDPGGLRGGSRLTQRPRRQRRRHDRRAVHLELYRRMLIDPPRRGPRAGAVPARRGLRHDAPLLRAGGGRGRLRERARARRPRRLHLPRARARARARHSSPARCSPSCSAARPASTAAVPGSMNIVDLDHGLIGCFGIVGGSIAAATGVALALRGHRPDRGRLLRRRHDQPGLLLRVPELREGARRCRWCSSARTTATASTRRWRRSRRARSARAPRRWRSRPGPSTAWTSTRRARRRWRSTDRRPRRQRPGVRRGAHLPLRRALAQRSRAATGPRASSSSGASAIRSTLAASWLREHLDGAEQRLAEVEAERRAR